MTAFDFINSDVPVVLSIASSDSGAGSGIQADLKTFSVLDVFGTCAITAVTAQTPTEFRRMHALPADLVKEQILAVSDGFPISAAKTGLLPTRELVEMVAEADQDCGIPILVVDPRMISSTGVRLLEADAVEALKECLLPVARVVTPNVHECEILAGFPIGSLEDLRKAAQTISERYDIACVATGGGLPGELLVDVLCDEGEITEFEHTRLKVIQTHGAGCTYSAALTAMIAKGMLLTDAVRESRELVSRALEQAWHVGPHFPLHLSVQ
ncbi:MAG: bifunctional hydroxymethylpyrimidine kinase/phosphomethylpyrimidine kinase [Kiritimatiellia bacterium]